MAAIPGLITPQLCRSDTVPGAKSGTIGPMRVTPSDFMARARSVDPRIDAMVDEHLQDNDELLVHLLVADLGRAARSAHDAGDTEYRDRLLALLDWGLTSGDEALDNAVAVSFVEHSAWTEPKDYLAAWPPGLSAELLRQDRA